MVNKTNIRLIVPRLARELTQNDYSLILCYACDKAGLKYKDSKFELNLPGFSDWFGEGVRTNISTRGIFSFLVATAYDYRNLNLGNFQMRDDYYPFPELYSPRISGWNVFNGSVSSIARIKDSHLRNFIACFYESLRDFPQKYMDELEIDNPEKEGYAEVNPQYPKIKAIREDFEIYFRNPDKYDERYAQKNLEQKTEGSNE